MEKGALQRLNELTRPWGSGDRTKIETHPLASSTSDLCLVAKQMERRIHYVKKKKMERKDVHLRGQCGNIVASGLKRKTFSTTLRLPAL